MHDAPPWTEPGEDTGGRSFPGKPRPENPTAHKRGPIRAPGEAKRITGATCPQALRAAPRQRSQTKPDPKAKAKAQKKARKSGPK